jgi:hypothetical protein
VDLQSAIDWITFRAPLKILGTRVPVIPVKMVPLGTGGDNYGRFYKSALYSVFRHFNGLLVRWAMRKFKRLRRHRRRAEYWLGGIGRREPRLFAHWQLLGLKPAAG